jgi:hypothetical protein
MCRINVRYFDHAGGASESCLERHRISITPSIFAAPANTATPRMEYFTQTS